MEYSLTMFEMSLSQQRMVSYNAQYANLSEEGVSMSGWCAADIRSSCSKHLYALRLIATSLEYMRRYLSRGLLH